MSRSDGKSAAPLRKRKSKRFDLSASNQRPSDSTDEEAGLAPTVGAAVGVDSGDEPAEVAKIESDHLDEASVDASGPEPADADETIVDASDASPTDVNEESVKTGEAGSDEEPATSAAERPGPTVVTEGTVRSKTLDERHACGRCGHELSMVNIEVDGNVLIMESCDNCDARRWNLAGEPIELQQVLDHVGEHAGRRR